MSQADWKPLPTETWIQRQARILRDVPRARWIGFVLLVGLLSTFQFFRLQSRDELASFLPWVLVYGFIVSSLLFIGSEFKPCRGLRLRLDWEPLSRCPVRMTLLKDDCPIGRDEGLVYIDGGLLVYDGLLTGFRLASDNVSAPMESFAAGPLMKAKGEQFKFGNVSGCSAWGFLVPELPGIRIYFFPLRAEGRPSVYSVLWEWLREKPKANGQVILPPDYSLPGFRPHWLVSAMRRGK